MNVYVCVFLCMCMCHGWTDVLMVLLELWPLLPLVSVYHKLDPETVGISLIGISIVMRTL